MIWFICTDFFNPVFQLDGRLQLLSEKVIFKNSKTGKVDTVLKKDLQSAIWRRVAREFELKLNLNNGQSFKFDGFKENVIYIDFLSVL